MKVENPSKPDYGHLPLRRPARASDQGSSTSIYVCARNTPQLATPMAEQGFSTSLKAGPELPVDRLRIREPRIRFSIHGAVEDGIERVPALGLMKYTFYALLRLLTSGELPFARREKKGRPIHMVSPHETGPSLPVSDVVSRAMCLACIHPLLPGRAGWEIW